MQAGLLRPLLHALTIQVCHHERDASARRCRGPVLHLRLRGTRIVLAVCRGPVLHLAGAHALRLLCARAQYCTCGCVARASCLLFASLP